MRGFGCCLCARLRLLPACLSCGSVARACSVQNGIPTLRHHRGMFQFVLQFVLRMSHEVGRYGGQHVDVDACKYVLVCVCMCGMYACVHVCVVDSAHIRAALWGAVLGGSRVCRGVMDGWGEWSEGASQRVGGSGSEAWRVDERGSR